MAKSIAEIKEAARKSAFSSKWFKASTLEHWNCIVYSETFTAGDNVTLFITSEAMEREGSPHAVGRHAYRAERCFTVRLSAANGEITNVSSFMAFRKKSTALRVAEQVATWWRTDTGLHGDEFEEWLRSQEDAQ